MKSIYFDWAATAPIHPEIPAIISDSLLKYQGNPSSIHSSGKNTKNQIDSSRKTCAELLKTKPEQLIFTSGGTESNSIVLSSLFLKRSGSHIIISAIEHPSIYEYITNLKIIGFEVDLIKPDSDGIIVPEMINKLLKTNTSFISIMTVNNETGAIQPVKDLVSEIRKFENKNGRHIHIHTDAVQALGKISFNPALVDVDSASFSAHKIGGPKGIGILYLKKSIQVLSPGGGQEFALRPGTENVSGIIAFTKALELSLDKIENNSKHVKYLRSLLIKELSKTREIKLLFNEKETKGSFYSPYIISMTVFPIPGEVLVRILSDEGIQISTGSACSSRNRKKQIRTLSASGVSEKEASGSIRISLGWSSTEAEILQFCSILKKNISKLIKYHK
ncbi:MAG: cysteine desulfurase [Spirochaetales bacterium]|nr:cysteine desulfurase [Spirochaetales bacterium]